MDSILLILAFFALLKSLLMTSLLPNRWYRLAFALLTGGFVVLCHPYALGLNKLKLQGVLSTQEALMNISLLVMADLLLSGYFCLARIRDREENAPFRWYTVVLRHMPSILVFPALFYIQISLFYTLTGVDFVATTFALAGGTALLYGLAAFFMRKWADKELLIEMTGILTLLICALVICCTIFHPSATVFNRAQPVDWRGCLGTAGALFLLFSTGYLWTTGVRLYKKFKNSKH